MGLKKKGRELSGMGQFLNLAFLHQIGIGKSPRTVLPALGAGALTASVMYHLVKGVRQTGLGDTVSLSGAKG